MQKVCVTGIGLITSLTQSPEQFAKLVKNQTPFFAKTKLSREPHEKEYPAAIINLSRAKIPNDPNRRKMGRASIFALTALDSCLTNSGLNEEEIQDLGLLIATQSGEINHIEDYYLSFIKDGPHGASAFNFPNTVLNSIGGFLSIHFGLKNFNHTFASRETSGYEAIEYAKILIEQNKEERILIVGTEEISPALLKSFEDIEILAKYENDRLTNGLIMAEGACALMLESEQAAKKRNAKIIGIIQDISHVPLKPENCTKVDPITPSTGEFFGGTGVFSTAYICLNNSQKALIESTDINSKYYNICVSKPW